MSSLGLVTAAGSGDAGCAAAAGGNDAWQLEVPEASTAPTAGAGGSWAPGSGCGMTTAASCGAAAAPIVYVRLTAPVFSTAFGNRCCGAACAASTSRP